MLCCYLFLLGCYVDRVSGYLYLHAFFCFFCFLCTGTNSRLSCHLYYSSIECLLIYPGRRKVCVNFRILQPIVIQLLTWCFWQELAAVRFHVFIAWVTYYLVICQILTFILQTDILILEEAAYCDEDKFPPILLSFCCSLLACFLVPKVTLFVYVCTFFLRDRCADSEHRQCLSRRHFNTDVRNQWVANYIFWIHCIVHSNTDTILVYFADFYTRLIKMTDPSTG